MPFPGFPREVLLPMGKVCPQGVVEFFELLDKNYAAGRQMAARLFFVLSRDIPRAVPSVRRRSVEERV